MITFALIDSLIFLIHTTTTDLNRRAVSLGRALLTPCFDFTSSFQIQLQDLDLFPNL